MRIGVVAALPVEAAAFGGRSRRPGDVEDVGEAVLSCSGIGIERAARAAEQLVSRQVDGLVSWGTAGGLSSAVRAGDLLLATEVRALGGASWVCDAQWRLRLERQLGDRVRVRVGPLLASDVVVADPEDKAELALTGVLGVDMESHAVAEIARRNGLPFIVVRAVWDPVDFLLPRTRGLVRSLLRPVDFLRHVRLLRGLHAARETLRRVVTAAGPGLAASGPSG